jgi:folate-binding protein YgfZ
VELKMHRGAHTAAGFREIASELQTLLTGAGVFDLGYRTVLRATGKDRVRWLNGMITQTVKGLVPGQVAYTLVLNPQGRIQGDADVYCSDEFLLLETDRSQSERLLTHLRRYIIMDDVKLEGLDALTALGMAGPQAGEVLAGVGAAAPEAGRFQTAEIGGVEVTVVAHGQCPLVPRFEVHVAAEQVLTVWKALMGAGAAACGTGAVEHLRILEGVPLYGVDFSDKHLPQEANLPQALNSTKGCYIGQEIVERIRARATVHRALRQFELSGAAPRLGSGEKIELRSGDAAAGELTSVAAFDLPGLGKTLALGVVRVEALERGEKEHVPITYEGGTAVPLAAPPHGVMS